MKKRRLWIEVLVIVGAAATLGLLLTPAPLLDGERAPHSGPSQRVETPHERRVTTCGIAPGMTRDEVEARFGKPVATRIVRYYLGERLPRCTYGNGTTAIYTFRDTVVSVTGNSLELDGKRVGHTRSSAADLRQRLGPPEWEGFGGSLFYGNQSNIICISPLMGDRVWYKVEWRESDAPSGGAWWRLGKMFGP